MAFKISFFFVWIVVIFWCNTGFFQAFDREIFCKNLSYSKRVQNIRFFCAFLHILQVIFEKRKRIWWVIRMMRKLSDSFANIFACCFGLWFWKGDTVVIRICLRDIELIRSYWYMYIRLIWLNVSRSHRMIWMTIFYHVIVHIVHWMYVMCQYGLP